MPETRTTKAASTQGADSAGSELVTMATLRELLKATKVKKILKEKLNLDEERDIERAHRVGRRANATTGSVRRPRTIVCRLRDWKQKELIIRSARRIKPPGIFVNEDLAQETLDKREEQRPKFEEARRNGKIAYFVLDRLVIKDRIERPS